MDLEDPQYDEFASLVSTISGNGTSRQRGIGWNRLKSSPLEGRWTMMGFLFMAILAVGVMTSLDFSSEELAVEVPLMETESTLISEFDEEVVKAESALVTDPPTVFTAEPAPKMSTTASTTASTTTSNMVDPPTMAPTLEDTEEATEEAPTSAPTATAEPSVAPTVPPTVAPTTTDEPTVAPTAAPTVAPTTTDEPTAVPTAEETQTDPPTVAPTQADTDEPTSKPTKAPSPSPNDNTTTQVSTANEITHYFRDTKLRKKQISNFQHGQAILLNVHITHHGGTVFCGHIGHAPGIRAPSKACNGAKPPKDHVGEDYPVQSLRPWSHEDTDINIPHVKKYFDVISWEFSSAPIHRDLKGTNWEHEDLVSVIVMRDPISRMLAADGFFQHHLTGIRDGTADLQEWWEFANLKHHTNNFALSILAGHGCCQGSETDPIHLEHAKELISRFTFVLDIACFDDGLQALADKLGMGVTVRENEAQEKRHVHADPKDRIPYPEVYEYLLERNKLDIELYEWSKTISLVDCAGLK